VWPDVFNGGDAGIGFEVGEEEGFVVEARWGIVLV
jgi:hypothetical protein